MKRIIIALTIACAMIAGSAMAQSAKFAAVYKDDIDPTFVRSEDCASTEIGICEALGITANDTNEVASHMAKIKVPQSKELLVGLSAQVALFTSTQVKGKRGSYAKAVASAEGGVRLEACNMKTETCYEAAPGHVTLSYRSQTLEAVLAGVIEDCDVEVTLTDDTGPEGEPDGIPDSASGEFQLADCTVLDEMIGLGIDTLAAHHFNFLFPNLPQGDYDVYAVFSTSASASAEQSCYYEDPDNNLGCEDTGEETSGNATGHAYAYIGKYMMTVQTVRAINSDFGEPVIVD